MCTHTHRHVYPAHPSFSPHESVCEPRLPFFSLLLCANWVQVRYLGWSFSSQPDKFDEMISCSSSRLALSGTKTTSWRRVQVGDFVTQWCRPNLTARNELKDFTVAAIQVVDPLVSWSPACWLCGSRWSLAVWESWPLAVGVVGYWLGVGCTAGLWL
jgi:hypothetical protein